MRTMRRRAPRGTAPEDPLDKQISRCIEDGDYRQLEDMLDCHLYTGRNDERALEGLGWKPVRLARAQRRRIERYLQEH